MRASPPTGARARRSKKAFEAECGCDVEFVSVADGVALLNRVKLEGAATKADIVLGLDTNLTAEAKATGLFAPHGVDQSDVNVPGGWSDDTFVPFDYGYFAVVYDTEKLKTPPKSLKELVEGDRRREDRHRGSAHLDAGPRPAAVGEVGLWRQGAGGLGQAQGDRCSP